MPKVIAIRRAVSIKNGSGTILINKSVAGFKIHKSLSKKIWWNTIKYLEKSLATMAAMTRAAAKNNPVPRQREPGTTVFKMFLRSGFFLLQNTRSAAYAAVTARPKRLIQSPPITDRGHLPYERFHGH